MAYREKKTKSRSPIGEIQSDENEGLLTTVVVEKRRIRSMVYMHTRDRLLVRGPVQRRPDAQRHSKCIIRVLSGLNWEKGALTKITRCSTTLF